MNPKDLFRVVAAGIGLYAILQGAMFLVDAVEYTLQLSSYAKDIHSSPQFYAVRGLSEIVVGVLIMVGFFPFADWAFPEKKEDDSDDESGDTPED